MITEENPANRPRPADPVLELVGEVPDLAGVRRWTGEVLADLTEDEITDAKLVVSELVTNAYQHGQPPSTCGCDAPVR
ncbi:MULTISPECIES: ATP-binding protein [Saccharothrix]|uniref:ATP-binding protein n=1 Tax=Saccharothrix TaxID=2071 RepID=UPI00095F2E40|nr:hypothetical protein [Saccharothrix sp. CB00851]OKI19822.1 hypothetical protein A6A25_38705 [Saccharothrix sp. CB00851]